MTDIFAIGKTAGSVSNLESDLGLIAPNQDPFIAARVEIDQADAQVSRHGWGQTGWSWAFIPTTHMAQLRLYCPGSSADVIIRAYDETGAAAYFDAVMVWPAEIASPIAFRDLQMIFDFKISFRIIQNLGPTLDEYYP